YVPGIETPSPLRGEKAETEPSSTGGTAAGYAAPPLHPRLQSVAPPGPKVATFFMGCQPLLRSQVDSNRRSSSATTGRSSCHSSGRSHHHLIRALQKKSPTANSKLVPSQPVRAVANVRGIRMAVKRAKIASSFPLSSSTQFVSSVGLYGRGCLS